MGPTLKMEHNHITRDIKSAGICPSCDFSVRKELERRLAAMQEAFKDLSDQANSLAL